jgi:hypothetical protein
MEFSNKLDYSKIIEMINLKKPFSFARYGDGEWNAIFGKEGANCDGHTYYKKMGEMLEMAVKANPKYYMGMQPLSINLMEDTLNRYFENNNIFIDWVNADILHNASIDGMFKSLFDALDRSTVIMVAPKSKHAIIEYFNYDYFIEVSEKNCWNDVDRIIMELGSSIKKVNDSDDIPVILFCASMASNYIIDLFHHVYSKRVIMIDAGSIFDPYVGNNIRTYHKNLKFNVNDFKKGR